MRIQGIRPIKQSDHTKIAQWYRDRNQVMPSPQCLSSTGFICDERVALWIYLTNSNLALIEGVIADKNTIPSLRRDSLDRLIGFAVNFCIAAGCTQIIGLTKHPSIEALGSKYGFKLLKSHKILYLNAD